MTCFHEVRFPIEVSSRSRGGPERVTTIVATGSGREQRNARWAHSRRRYDAGYGVNTPAAIAMVLAFFEERRGRLYGFRWRDRSDCKSCASDAQPGPRDQRLGAGDGATRTFQLIKIYGGAFEPYARDIHKPVAGMVRVALDGAEKRENVDFDIDATTGRVTFRHPPKARAIVTAGFVFDTPVRFDTDYLEIDHAALASGRIPKIPLVEIRPW